MNLISVILPTYNSECFIVPMLESLSQQTYQPIEIVIIDDASTDQTLSIIHQYLQKPAAYQLYKIIHLNQNAGLTHAINIGIQNAGGQYIALADHDDIWLENKLEKQYLCLQKHPDAIGCLCDRQLINEKGDLILKSEYEYIDFKTEQVSYPDILKSGIRFSSNTMFFKNIGANHLKIPERIVQHDYFLMLVLSQYGNIRYIHQPLVKYRIHKNNLSANYAYIINLSFKNFKRSFQNIKKRRWAIKNNDIPIINAYLKKINRPEQIKPKTYSFFKQNLFFSYLLLRFKIFYRKQKKKHLFG